MTCPQCGDPGSLRGKEAERKAGSQRGEREAETQSERVQGFKIQRQAENLRSSERRIAGIPLCRPNLGNEMLEARICHQSLKVMVVFNIQDEDAVQTDFGGCVAKKPQNLRRETREARIRSPNLLEVIRDSSRWLARTCNWFSFNEVESV
jgi:hypothetical protein